MSKGTDRIVLIVLSLKNAGTFKIVNCLTEAFFTALNEQGYSGNVILELYRNGFGETDELAENCVKMQNYLDKFDY